MILGVMALAGSSFAQNSNTSAAAAPAPAQTEVISENDHLPFMHTEETAAAQEPTSGGLLLKTFGSMLLIVGLIFFGAWGAKKLGFGGTKGNAADGDIDLAVLSSVSLGNNRTISTVRFGERVLVIGSTPQSFTLLAEETPGERMPPENRRSVAEMLAEEEDLFETEFQRASFELREGGQA